MTGFGRAEHATDHLVARVEISSINRKQGEVLIQIPRTFAELEPGLRKLALKQISRGRLTVNIQIEYPTTAANALSIDTQKVEALHAELARLSRHLNHPLELNTADILRLPDILQTSQHTLAPEDALAAIQPAMEKALKALTAMRKNEGDHLKQDTIQRLKLLENEAAEISAHAPSVLTRYRENLHKRLAESGLEIDLDDDRLLKEIALFAERCDIAEELTRLDSHFTKFKEYLDSNKPAGRSLDFLCQEINREFNTIGSKANDATLAQHVVTAKTELEKIREQIQNIE